MEYLRREKYLSKIRPFYHDTELIKVLTGVRRSGKTTIMKQIAEELISDGCDNIAFIDLDSEEYFNIETADDLYGAIKSHIKENGGIDYLFLDEVQNVNGFEKVVNAFRNDGTSVFITGSNSYLLSGELVTKLTGRYLEFDIFPFSFKEIVEFKRLNKLEVNLEREFLDYVRNGGFPRRFEYDTPEGREFYTKTIVKEVMTKDILRRNRNHGKQGFEKVLEYVMSTPGATISSTSISGILKNEGLSIKPDTVNRYLKQIFDSKLASKCERIDLVGKNALRTLYKSYVADPALHTYYSSPRTEVRMGVMVENIVYNELISCGYQVSIGKLGAKEIDFIVSNGHKIAYVQVTYLMPTPETELREIAPLISIKDVNPKYIISMNPVPIDVRGVVHLNLIHDFLLGDGFKLDS